MWLAFAVPISFILIGAGGLIHTLFGWGRSAERRSIRVRGGVERDFLGLHGQGDRRCPFVPERNDITNSPGTKLQYRLPIGGSLGWKLAGLLAACVIWNGIVAVFVVDALRRRSADNPNYWIGAFFIVLFLLAGLGIFAYFLRQLAVAAGIGPTRLEISDHPLHPGGKYRLFISQSGRLSVNALRVSLTCAESATYRQGTDTRSESREVIRRELFYREGFAIRGGAPFETEIEFDVPAGAMHSFAAQHNEINWALTVEGDVARWPGFQRVFSVIVRPGIGETRP